MNHTPQPDLDWLDEATAWGWKLPERAHPFLRRWGIRHVRSWIMLGRAYIFPLFGPPVWREMWYREWLSYAIRRGWI